MTELAIQPFTRPFDIKMSPPGSKSLTNRALVLAALGEGTSELSNVLFADDTLVMLDNLAKLGFAIDIDRDHGVVKVDGRGGTIPATATELFCGNSGTTIRFLTAMCALGRGTFTLDGIARMRERPIGPLGELLKNLGARLQFGMKEGYPPVTVLADRLPGGRCSFGTSTSSQFLSAVLQVAPYTRHETLVDLDSPQTSWPYVAMTMRLMDEFDHTPELVRDPLTGDPKQIIIPQGAYRATKYAIEPDASNASYFLAAAAIHPGSKITISDLGKHSLQGDVGFAEKVLRRMGADVTVGANSITVVGPDHLEAIDVDLSAMPDTAQTLAVASLFARGETTIRGLHTLRVKETDRISALATELQKLGAAVRVEGDDLSITPPAQLRPASIATYDDHRMAMSFALAGSKSPGVVIQHPECVNKTYPAFFDDLLRLQ